MASVEHVDGRLVSQERKLNQNDVQLIGQLKAERKAAYELAQFHREQAETFRQQAKNISDVKIAEKFDVSKASIERVPEWIP